MKQGDTCPMCWEGELKFVGVERRQAARIPVLECERCNEQQYGDDRQCKMKLKDVRHMP